jgi:hypothetical protein
MVQDGGKSSPQEIRREDHPDQGTDDPFKEHLRPFLSRAKRGPVCKIPLVKVFNYILYHLHEGCA